MVTNEYPEPDDRHARLKRLFFQAVELTEEARARFVQKACLEDPKLRAELESLLDCHRQIEMSEASGPRDG